MRNSEKSRTYNLNRKFNKRKTLNRNAKVKVQVQTLRPKCSLSFNLNPKYKRQIPRSPERRTSIGNLLNEKLQIEMQKFKSKVRSQKSKYKVQVQTQRPKSS